MQGAENIYIFTLFCQYIIPGQTCEQLCIRFFVRAPSGCKKNAMKSTQPVEVKTEMLELNMSQFILDLKPCCVMEGASPLHGNKR